MQFSLEALAKEGFVDVAYHEAEKLKSMTEPVARSAVERLASDPSWKKYAKP